ncbi:hypothetical protein HS1genome_0874 [Sulfodiicoccus acidiphilus]|uniref:Uncharacterized protein n=1 Tax=Sulfodiicoccus acidiphilus TaxID=1670455 RepID=A0A348B2T3_9CREN|nr:hypothetical protein [Sulfodiicoccus acidiphilus]BBD72485.1 hypothetical protein HS1genome_0874 [Sulfodiicoccus acidiphilus]GGT96789.1 hypothetical protein GCM10007116_12850 [Sulfodiicoccus acidiphilus]
MDKGDEVIILRGLMGAATGVLSFLTYSHLLYYTFALPLTFYVISVLVVRSRYPGSGRWIVLGKGVSTFIISWLLLWILLVQ